MITDRMKNFYTDDNSGINDADRQWIRVIYRSIDLDKDENATLYYPCLLYTSDAADEQ